MTVIPRSFYGCDTVDVAKKLLGKILVRQINGEMISGIIVETEAYRYKDDEASHTYRGMTKRNRAMFGQVGKAYVYFTYGMHYCVNAVARSPDYEAGAVLLRSLVPQQGIDFMMRQRSTSDISNLTNGPAKLTQALNVTIHEYGEDLTKQSGLYIIEGLKIKKSDIVSGPRIGIKKATDKMWNFKLRTDVLSKL
ncbi:putative 3-methyladenine DNA glycosylase [Nitrosotalea sinensis]|uniref:Putative 3-methyladenine DNA glycosylase n=1 Tax=Nitrosotalea sinensis TaxID=1499975 RepID=A0A2H1EIT4_9ARCH|nr:DNA-3-methyladenine glycosylase [Candidatus Nitrosotalea sinensis]SHO47441.1 putative 3-methyladenine DNA glycosylase [Candidatus Nitrosotalea sinensis]